MQAAATRLVFFHGSPGFPDDISHVLKHLPGVTCDGILRSRYPKVDGTRFSDIPDSSLVFVGYSWGFVAALRAAAVKPERVAGLIGIAPYLEREGGSSWLRSMVVGSALGKLLIRGKREKLIGDFLQKSSAPHPVSDAYADVGARLRDPAVFQAAVKEKSDRGLPVDEACWRLKGIPTLLLAGADDQVGKPLDDLRFLQRELSVSASRVIAGASHALLWTHPAEVASAISDFLRGQK